MRIDQYGAIHWYLIQHREILYEKLMRSDNFTVRNLLQTQILQLEELINDAYNEFESLGGKEIEE